MSKQAAFPVIGERKRFRFMKIIGKKRGAVVSGGEIDDEKVSNIILTDFRSGKLGRITLEKVYEK